jgi:hypothetical protein
MKNVKPAPPDDPCVGLFWYFKKGQKYVFITKTMHKPGESGMETHYKIWYDHQAAGFIDKEHGGNWNTFSRGRVEYDPGTGLFSVYSGEPCGNGKCGNPNFVSFIKNAYNIPDTAVWAYSAHYDLNEDMLKYDIDGGENQEQD